MKAREDEKYLTKPEPGTREGGKATAFARQIVSGETEQPPES